MWSINRWCSTTVKLEWASGLRTSRWAVPSRQPPEYVENAPKDMVTALPDQVTRIKMTFDKPGRYVWHCHILSHEDHEMMRVLHVGPGARGFLDFAAYSLDYKLELNDDVFVDDNVGAKGKVDLKNRSNVMGTVISTGDDIELYSDSIVDGDVIAFDKIEGGGTVNGAKYPDTAATPALPVNFTVTAGSENIAVKEKKSLDLPSGVYGKLYVGECCRANTQFRYLRF